MADMAVGVKIYAEDSEYKKSLKEDKKLTEEFAKSVDKAGDKASGAYDGMGKSANGATKAVKGVMDSVKGFSRGSASSGVKGLTKAFEGAKEAADSTTNSVKSLVGYCTKIVAVVTAVVAVVKIVGAIITSAKKGLKDIAVLDKKLGNTMGINKTLSEIQTAYSKLKYQMEATFGTMLADLITTLKPAILFVLKGITKIVESISVLYSMLTGKDTYLKVDENYWEDYAESVEKAHEANKKLIAGFDELNTVNGKSNVLTGSPMVEAQMKDISALTSLLPLAILGAIPLIKKLIDSFREKNDVLDEQTAMTKTDTGVLEGFGQKAAAVASQVGKLALGVGALSAVGNIVLHADASQVSEATQQAAQDVQNMVNSTAASNALLVESVNQSAKDLATNTNSQINEMVANTNNAVGELTNNVLANNQQISASTSATAKQAVNNVQAATTNIKTNVAQTNQQILTQVNTTGTQVQNSVSNTGANILNRVKTTSTQIQTAIQQALNSAESKISAFCNKVYSTFVTAETKWNNSITSWGVNFNNQLQQALNSAMQRINAFVTQASNKLNSIRGYSSSYSDSYSSGSISAPGWKPTDATGYTQEAGTKTSSGSSGGILNAIKDSISGFNHSPDTTLPVGSDITTAAEFKQHWPALAAAVAAGFLTLGISSVVGKATGAKTSGEAIKQLADGTPNLEDLYNRQTMHDFGMTKQEYDDIIGRIYPSKESEFLQVVSENPNLLQDLQKDIQSLSEFDTAKITQMLKQFTGLKFADGGLIKKPTFGLMGEYAGANTNPEIISPKSTLQEIFNSSNDGVIQTVIQVGRQIISAIENNDLKITIGDDVIAKSAARGNNNYRRMTGKSLITV